MNVCAPWNNINSPVFISKKNFLSKLIADEYFPLMIIDTRFDSRIYHCNNPLTNIPEQFKLFVSFWDECLIGIFRWIL